MPAEHDSPDTSRSITLRVPARLETALSQLAARDHNNISATVRRLLSSAIALERRAEGQ